MLNLNSFILPTSNGDGGNRANNNNNITFPTVGLKSLLQNSELLELLMKPIANSAGHTTSEPIQDKLNIGSTCSNNNSNNNNNNFNFEGGDLSDLNIDDLLKVNEKICETKEEEASKTYGSAFLGPNLWDKNELFPGDKFNVEFLELDEFLKENSLSEDDVKFLDHLQKIETTPNQTVSKPTGKTNCSLSNQLVDLQLQKFSESSNGLGSKEPRDRLNSLTDGISMDSFSDSEVDSEFPISKKLLKDKLGIHPMLKKSKKQFVPNELKDEKYWARRNKNNIAAKRSRDTRRLKENQIVITATYLEQENENLRKQLEQLKKETMSLKTRLSRYESVADLSFEKK